MNWVALVLEQVCEAKLMYFLAQKDKEDLEEISGELELADEEDKVPYAVHSHLCPLRRRARKKRPFLLTTTFQIQNWRLLLQPTRS
jgi:hypothetical protein